jgi:VanZ family protein
MTFSLLIANIAGSNFNDMTRKIISGIIFSVWMIILILLSLLPSVNKIIRQDLSEFRWDYLEHFLCYFILGFLYTLWRIDKNLHIPVPEFILFLVTGSIFSWLTEYLQVFIPGRSFNHYDLISNMAGIISGTLISYFFIIRILLRNHLKGRISGI